MSRRLLYWSAFALALGVYGVMIVWTLPQISEGAGGLPPFDMRPFGYSPDEAQRFLDALSPEARALYLGPQHRLDLVYPALLAIVLIGASHTLWQDGRVRWFLILAAIVGMLADYAENYLVAEMLIYDGPIPDDMSEAANLATVTKSAATTIAMFGVLAGLLRFSVSKWKNR